MGTRTVKVHSHEVVEVGPAGKLKPGLLALRWIDGGGEEHLEWGHVSEEDYLELTNIDSPWFHPHVMPSGAVFRFTYEDPDWEPPSLDPSDPDYIEW